MTTLIAWVLRYGHVVFAAVWVGGYALLALALVPAMLRDAGSRAALGRVALASVRVLSFAGAATIAFGLILINYTRGYSSVFRGEWGGLILGSAIIAIALMGIGDGALRPALRRMIDSGDGTAARRWAVVGLVLSILAIGLMTRSVYAGSGAPAGQ